jgi:glutaredoxin
MIQRPKIPVSRKSGFAVLAIASGLLGFAWLPVYAQFYKWTDESGRTYYSDKAPDKGPAKKLDIKINSYAGAPVVSSLGKTATGASKERVRMLTTTWCGYCKQARAYLGSRGIAYEDLDVEKSTQGRQEYVALKGRGVPIITVGNRRMDGFDPAHMDEMLKSAGY